MSQGNHGIGWRILIGVAVAMVVAWLALAAFLLLARPEGPKLGEAAR
ncbi:MAG: hypothetical protein M3Q23_18740 [Actinomycetota bacterium]|nr:hypothetical protein [Actinomycetota bacterium]